MTVELGLEVAHAVLRVHDLDQMLDFYTRTLGFEVTDRGPLGRDEIVFLSQSATSHHQVAFITGRSAPQRSDNLNHVAFRSVGTLDGLKALHAALAADARITGIMPLTHGNAWSVYFQDPELNGIEVFIDTPWHVAQPQGAPLDLSRSNDEIIEWTHEHYAGEPRFGPMDAYFDQRAAHLGKEA